MLIFRISRRISNRTVGRPQRFSGSPAPVRSETGMMPTDRSVRLHDRRQGLNGIWHQTIQPNNDQAILGIEDHSLGHMPLLDVKLMTKNQDLSLQRDPRPEQKDQHRPDQAVSFSLETDALRHSASRTSRIRFPTETAPLAYPKTRFTPQRQVMSMAESGPGSAATSESRGSSRVID